MEQWKVAKDTFETTDDEISDQDAMEIIADWSVAVCSKYSRLKQQNQN